MTRLFAGFLTMALGIFLAGASTGTNHIDLISIEKRATIQEQVATVMQVSATVQQQIRACNRIPNLELRQRCLNQIKR